MAVLVVSPHLDDGVLSCGDLMAAHPGARLVTVFAGRPESGPLTDWDRDCGFAEGDDVVAARRAEDEAACAALGAVPIWLDFLDDQYAREPASLDAIEAALRDIVRAEQPDTIYIPLGLVHPDHKCAQKASRRLVGTLECDVVAYEDAPYRTLDGAVDARIAELQAAGLNPQPMPMTDSTPGAHKRDAIACYASQIVGLERHWPGFRGALDEERFWLLSR
jgi:LmbE family N-acetylglucosaminyl deacetylase